MTINLLRDVEKLREAMDDADAQTRDVVVARLCELVVEWRKPVRMAPPDRGDGGDAGFEDQFDNMPV